MPKKLFLIGIGGTGMRCLESFVHTCAMGMYDDTEVEMLALDTDENNGNFSRLRTLVNLYAIINGGKTKQNTFFSAKLKYYEFCPRYDSKSNFDSICDYATLNSRRIDKEHKISDPTADFVDMFLSPDVRCMNLQHGYRAQTQMGSMLMYYAIKKAAYEAKTGENKKDAQSLKDFLSSLSSDGKHPVFVFGSVFGGTGASSIPVIPLAFEKVAPDITGSASSIIDSNFFGSIVLTNYFNFTNVKSDANEVVARSDNFAVNSQAALMFYKENDTVKTTYKRLYLLGRSEVRNILDDEAGSREGVTGGEEQKNPADYIELIAAFAAYHFFKEATRDDQEPFAKDTERFYCMSYNNGSKLDFNLFAQDDGEIFKKKIGSLTVASLLSLTTDFFRSMANSGNMFETVDPDGKQMQALKSYLAMFDFGVDSSENLVSGWLPQMYNGRGGQGILFGEAIFNCKTLKELKKIKFNKDLFTGDKPPKFDVGLFSSIFDEVKKKFISTLPENRNSFDDLLLRSYATIVKLYFNE